MKNFKVFILSVVTLLGLSSTANADTIMLASDDFVGISFWIVSMACLAATVFLFFEDHLCRQAGEFQLLLQA